MNDFAEARNLITRIETPIRFTLPNQAQWVQIGIGVLALLLPVITLACILAGLTMGIAKMNPLGVLGGLGSLGSSYSSPAPPAFGRW